MKKLFLFSILFALTFSISGVLQAQTPEHLVPLRSNPVQAFDAIRISTQRSAASFPTDTITLPSQGLRDNFSYNDHRPDTNIWDLGLQTLFPASEIEPTGVFVNRTWAISPVNLGVCTFDGLKWNGQPYNDLANVNGTGPCDDLVSRPIDLTAYSIADSVYLSFWYEPQGRGYAPNQQDSFLLDFNIPAWNTRGTDTLIWKNIWYKEGYQPALDDSVFHLVMIKLDSASYFTKGFRFRFHNYASQCGSNDHWHLDEVLLKKNRTMLDSLSHDVDFVYPSTSALTDFWAVPHTHYKATMMANNFNIMVRNNDTITGGRQATYSYKVYDENNLLVPPAYNGGTVICPNYSVSGYVNSSALSNPPVALASFAFSQSAIFGDSTTFRIEHVLNSSTDIDTMVQTQKFYNYYAYDDGTAEVGYGLYGQYSQLAYKFKVSDFVSSDTLTAIQMYFLPVQDITNLVQRTFTLKVWSDAGNQPGTLIYSEDTQSPSYNFETPDRFVTYKLDSGTVVLAGGQTYYIGWEQQAIDRLYIGFDFNTDHHDKIYYNTNGNWNTSMYNGSLMMRPVFGDHYDATGIHVQNGNAGFSVYPNPANDMITISGLDNSTENYVGNILDISGRSVISNQQISGDGKMDVSLLSAGVYFVQVQKLNGEIVGTQRLVISE